MKYSIYIYVRSITYVIIQVYYILFCLLLFYPSLKMIVKSPTVSVVLSISPFSSIIICVIYLAGGGGCIVWCVYVCNCYVFLINDTFVIHKVSFLSLVTVFNLIYFVWYQFSHPISLPLFAWKFFFCYFIFNILVSMGLKQVYYRQYTAWSCYIIHSTKLYLLIKRLIY